MCDESPGTRAVETEHVAKVRVASVRGDKILHVSRAMHLQTEPDIMHDRFYKKVVIGQQRTSREIQQSIYSVWPIWRPTGQACLCALASLRGGRGHKQI
jgi:hypothetical protein